MYTVKAVYDGVNFRPRQPISVKVPYEVIITFLEPIEEAVTDNTQSNKHPRSAFIGSWKDKIWMSDDFNEPLDEMKECIE